MSSAADERVAHGRTRRFLARTRSAVSAATFGQQSPAPSCGFALAAPLLGGDKPWARNR
jgi:hypothetical protein